MDVIVYLDLRQLRWSRFLRTWGLCRISGLRVEDVLRAHRTTPCHRPRGILRMHRHCTNR